MLGLGISISDDNEVRLESPIMIKLSKAMN